DGRGRYVAERNWQNSALLHPDVGRGSKLPDLVGPGSPSRDGVESAHDIELVLGDREASRQSGSLGTGPGRSNSADGVSDRVITEYAIENVWEGNLRTTHAVDVVSSSVIEHATGHVVYMGVGVGGRLSGPRVSNRIIFKRLSEFAAQGIAAAPAHGVKLPVSWEKDPNEADTGTWKVWTG